MEKIVQKIKQTGIIPVVVIDKVCDAIPLAQALMDGGIACAEITFRTEAAVDSIKAITKAFPQMLVGAGTVLTIEQADQAIAAGAKFIVTPGFNPVVVKHCLQNHYPVFPGVITPSEIEAALMLGIKAVKFFPAEAAGGINMLKAVSAPYPMVEFIPTGGINSGNAAAYLEFDKVIACGGSWLVKENLISEHKFDEIKALTREAAGIIKSVRQE